MNTTARITKGGKHYEILVDLDEALKIKKGEGNINVAVQTGAVFHNLKSGEQASSEDLKKAFGSDVFEDICVKIIKSGEIELPVEYTRKEQHQKYKQVVDFLVKNAVSPEGRPYTPDRIMKALEEGHVSVKNKPIDSQVSEIMDQISKVIPIRIEVKRVKIIIPAQYTGRAYGFINEFKESEEWFGNGDLQIVAKVPAGLIMNFYDKINSLTHGSAISEEIK